MVLCRYFQQSRCVKGDTCGFEHPKSPQSSPTATLVPTSRKNPKASLLKPCGVEKRSPCVFFRRGTCAKGDTCEFEHSRDLPTTTLPTANRVSHKAPLSGPHGAEKRSPCVFFQRGICKYGSTCINAHDQSEVSLALQASAADTRSNIVCTFFLQKNCYKGADCPFSHAIDFSLASAITNRDTAEDARPRQRRYEAHNKHVNTKDDESKQNSSVRIIAGATIIFADGAAISKVTLSADYSTLSMTNIPVEKKPEDFAAILKRWGYHGAVDVISLKVDPQTSMQVAEVKAADGGHISRAILSGDLNSKLDGSDICVFPVQLGTSEAGTNRLQLSGVTCMWHNPSRTATLRYGPFGRSTKAFADMQKQVRELHGRRPTFEHAQFHNSIRVGNLDGRTSLSDLKQYFNRHPPLNIELGSRSHGMSPKVIQQRVKASLEKYGQVKEWEVFPQSGVAKVKAYAKFSNPHEAAQAMKQLDGSRIDSRSNDLLRVQHVISIKVPVSQRVLGAIKPQLHALAETSRSTNHVSIKAYDNPFKAYTQIRVSGDEKMSVARIKIQVESLLAGTIAQDGTQPLVHPFFFQGASTAFLDKIMRVHAVVILRDRRKTVLRIYGEAQNVTAAQEALRKEIVDIESRTKEIILDPDTLAAAMRGGFQHVITALGKDKVKLDVTANPKRILVTGSDKHVELAKDVLKAHHSNLPGAIAGLTVNDGEHALCAVCWTPAEDPIKTSCGHTYCSACIDSQAVSTSDFPMICLGDSGKCETPLTLQELQRILPGSSYDSLLESALTKHIRTHAEEFQYCFTPDCDRFYRTSQTETAIVFNCDRCLASICTACHRVSHEGETCTEAKAGRDGVDEFAEWKKKNDVRDCPTCSAPIEKIAGCNHMTCKSCEAHICWHCMKVFKTSPEVYKHMNNDHNQDWGLGWTPQDFQ